MSGFDEAWAAVALSRNGEPVSPGLRPLIETVHLTLLSNPLVETDVKTSLEHLLKFLAADGRTNANCWAVDLFFGESRGWKVDWAERGLSEDLHDILAKMGEALHDTVNHPEIAENFGCLPEQLLQRLRGRAPE